MAHIYLVRHGEARGTKSGLDKDFHLTKTGIKQAHAIGKFFKYKKVKFNKIYSSSLTRAKETAAIIKKCTPAPVEIWFDLYEQGAKQLAKGVSSHELYKKYHSDFSKIHAKVITAPDVDWNAAANGETIRSLCKRAKRIWKHLHKKYAESEKTILIVAHGMILNFLVYAAMGFHYREALHMGWYNAACLHLQFVRVKSGHYPVIVVDNLHA